MILQLASSLGIGFLYAVSNICSLLVRCGYCTTHRAALETANSCGACGVLCCIVAIQGGVDYYLWGRPFVEIREYILYNIANKYNYRRQIPGEVPICYCWLVFLFRRPSAFYILWHGCGLGENICCYFFLRLSSWPFTVISPTNSERFILPIVPFFIMGGLMGWQEFSKVPLPSGNNVNAC